MLDGTTNKWDHYLPLATHYYNTTTRSLTGSSPYALMFARSHNYLNGNAVAVDDFDWEAWLKDNDVESWIPEHHQRLNERMQTQKRVLDMIYPAVKERIAEKRQKTARTFEKRHKIVPALPPGTHVLIQEVHPGSKWSQNYVGPYRVRSITDNGTYILQGEQGEILKRAISQLKRIPAEGIAAGQRFTVEKILRHRTGKSGLEYLVKWLNYPSSVNSWIKPSDFDNEHMISKYWKSKAPKRQTKTKSKSRYMKRNRSA